MRTMRLMLIALAGAIVALAGDVRPGAARQWYPWCAMYADRSGITACGFDTFEQCLETVRGIGGSCIHNWYPPPAARPRHERYWRPFYR